jgi:hypothetical protein
MLFARRSENVCLHSSRNLLGTPSGILSIALRRATRGYLSGLLIKCWVVRPAHLGGGSLEPRCRRGETRAVVLLDWCH